MYTQKLVIRIEDHPDNGHYFALAGPGKEGATASATETAAAASTDADLWGSGAPERRAGGPRALFCLCRPRPWCAQETGMARASVLTTRAAVWLTFQYPTYLSDQGR